MGFTPLFESPLRGQRGRDGRSDPDDSGVVIGDEWSIASLSKAGVNTLGVLGAGTVTGRDAGPYSPPLQPTVLGVGFLIAVCASRPEVVELKYNSDGDISSYKIRSFNDTPPSINVGKAFQAWKESVHRRKVDDYQFELNPENCDPDKFNNLFTGKLPMSHIEPQDMCVSEEELAYLQPILQHILVHFCGGEDELS
ncbi:g6226 [Coccomyxa elongata]